MAEEDDISTEELEALYNKIDAEIAERGLPSDEELRREIERLNKSAKNRRRVAPCRLTVRQAGRAIRLRHSVPRRRSR